MPSSTKKIQVDADIYIGSQDDSLTGLLCYFNKTDFALGFNETMPCHIEAMVRRFMLQKKPDYSQICSL